MAKEFNHSQENDYTPLMAERELLAALLESEDTSYPWNLAESDACEAYFAQIEEVDQIWSEAELKSRSQSFYAQLNQLWSNVTSANQPDWQLSQFADYLPPAWLTAIAHKAKQISSHKLLADQLVECVQQLLPNWAEEDLFVLARPFAYAMRGTQTQIEEVVLNNIHDRDWTSLSEIEQARVSLAIAYLALQADAPPD